MSGTVPQRAEALECFEDLLDEIILEPLLNLQNVVADRSIRHYVIEGVPTLSGRKKGR
jgi:hypothetical protein